MEGFEAENAQPIVGSKDKIPEHTNFIKVEVDCIAAGQQIPGTTTGYLVREPGKAVVTVGPRDLAHIESMMEDPALIDFAKAQFERNIDHEVSQRYGKILGNANRPWTAEDVGKSRQRHAESPAEASEKDVQASQFRKELLEKTGTSWQSVFQALNHRSPRPFVGMQVLDDKVLHPEEVRRQRYEADNAAKMGAILKEALAENTKRAGKGSAAAQ